MRAVPAGALSRTRAAVPWVAPARPGWRRVLDRALPPLLIWPPLLVASAHVVLFTAWTTWISFTPSTLMPSYGWEGLRNYRAVLASRNWTIAFDNLIVFRGLFVGLATALGLLLAVLLDQRVRGEAVLRTMFLYPLAVSFVVTGTVWSWLLNPGLGVQKLVRDLGWTGFRFDWLVNRDMALYTLIIAGAWHASGFAMALFLAGLRTVDADLVRAAQIDGAGPWRIYCRVVLPSIGPIFVTVLVILLQFAIKTFDLVRALTGGGGADAAGAARGDAAVRRLAAVAGAAVSLSACAVAIEIGGRSMAGVPPRDRDIAMVFQSYALYPSMTVRQNITFGVQCRRVPRLQQREAVARVLQIEPLLGRKSRQLSGGQRQRVAMGRALVRDPLLFLFDEPLSNLDAKLRVEMRTEIKQLHQRLGATIIYVTHDQIEATTLASRIAVMQAGRVQQFADSDTVYNRPTNPFVARFMGAPPMNTLPARLRAEGGGLSAVIGAGESGAVSLRLPRDPGPLRDYLGRDVILGIRPECIAEADRRFGGGGPDSAQIDAAVEMTEPAGAETIVVLRLGGERVLGRVAPDVRLTPGRIARFNLDLRTLCLFDPATEELIA